MGCVSSSLLSQEDEIGRLGSSALSQHIVSLTSTTYGLLNLDPPKQSPTTPPIPPPRFTAASLSDHRPLRSDPDVINSWELLDGLDADSFRFSVPPIPKPKTQIPNPDKENATPTSAASDQSPLEKFEFLPPPGGEDKAVVYTTTLRGVRRTFEACNAVRALMEGLGVSICERDVSMDRGFREEVRELMKGKDTEAVELPKVFVKGRYLGGAEEVLGMAEEGRLADLVGGLPKRRGGSVCEGCGGVRFLPCFHCSGSCKVVTEVREGLEEQRSVVVVKCAECNENGLVLCPICS